VVRDDIRDDAADRPSGSSDAHRLHYDPADLTDWTGSADPGNVGDALDSLANGGGGANVVTSSAVLADNAVLRGDGGSRGIQDSGLIVSDGNDLTFPADDDAIYLGAGSPTDGIIRFDSVTQSLYLATGGGNQNIALVPHGTGKTLIYGDIQMGSSGADLLDWLGAELIGFTATPSAVNEVHITNAATGTTGPLIGVSGETNVDLRLGAAGTGSVTLAADMASGGNAINMGTTDKVTFRDANQYINSSASGYLDIHADNSGGGLITLDSYSAIDFYIAAGFEARLQASKLYMAATDSSGCSIDWSTSNALAIYGGGTKVMDFASTGPDSGSLNTKMGNVVLKSATGAGGASQTWIGASTLGGGGSAVSWTLPSFGWTGTTKSFILCRIGTALYGIPIVSQA